MKLIRDQFLCSKQVNAGDLRCCVKLCFSVRSTDRGEMTLVKERLFRPDEKAHEQMNDDVPLERYSDKMSVLCWKTYKFPIETKAFAAILQWTLMDELISIYLFFCFLSKVWPCKIWLMQILSFVITICGSYLTWNNKNQGC